MRKRRSASSCGYLGKAGPVLAVYSSLGLFPRPWIWMSGSAVKGVCGSPSVPEVASLYVSCTITIEVQSVHPDCTALEYLSPVIHLKLHDYGSPIRNRELSCPESAQVGTGAAQEQNM